MHKQNTNNKQQFRNSKQKQITCQSKEATARSKRLPPPRVHQPQAQHQQEERHPLRPRAPRVAREAARHNSTKPQHLLHAMFGDTSRRMASGRSSMGGEDEMTLMDVSL